MTPRPNEGELSPSDEAITDEKALEFLHKLVDGWNFFEHTPQENAQFVLHLSHWLAKWLRA